MPDTLIKNPRIPLALQTLYSCTPLVVIMTVSLVDASIVWPDKPSVCGQTSSLPHTYLAIHARAAQVQAACMYSEATTSTSTSTMMD